MKPTPQQRVAVEHRDGNLIVAASAGSGKTEVLARRCVSLIADEQRPCDVTRLLVVTFTRAAAAEMRARVARYLRQAAAATGDSTIRRHLRRQEVLIDAAEITTIDAWCGRLLREHAERAGVDPDFAMLDEQEGELLRKRELDALLADLYRADDSPGPELRDWVGRTAPPQDDFIRDLVIALNAFRERVVNPAEWRAAIEAHAEPAAALRLLGAALAAECRFQSAELGRLLTPSGDEAGSVALAPYRDQLDAWATRLDADAASVRDVAAAITEHRLVKPRGKAKAAGGSAVVDQVREQWLKKRLQKHWGDAAIGPLCDAAPDAARWLKTLLAIESLYQARLDAAKRSAARYGFGDVQRMALDLLGTPAPGGRREPSDVALDLRERYAYVLVDECQDTSPVQMTMLQLVSREAAARGNAFFVGDVKQSIYGFREAEPRLMADLMAAYRADPARGRVQPLAENFRSHAGVLEPLNALFARLFDPAFGGTDFDDAARLRAARDEIDNPTLRDRPRATLHILEHDAKREATDADDDGGAIVERIEREAQLAADHIHALLDAGTQVPERGPDGCLRLRPMRLGDVAILLRAAAKNATHVARVLRAAGLRCVASGRESLLDGLEVLDVVNVLRLLVNRRQDVPLAAYLRGPLVGLTPPELLAIRGAGPGSGADLLDCVERASAAPPDADRVARELSARLTAALTQLDRWEALAREAGVAALVSRILGETALPLFALGLHGGPQRVAMIEALQSLAAAFDQPAAGVAEFVARLDALEAVERLPAAATPVDDDAVRILTIHGSKGLEFPVVFLLNAGAAFNRRNIGRALLCDAALGAGLKFFDYPQRHEIRSAAHHVTSRRVAVSDLEEELRLLYVATTRARELLFIVGTSKPGAWAGRQTRHADGAPLLLIDRLEAASPLDWVMMAAAAARLPANVLAADVRPATDIRIADVVHPQPVEPPPLTAEDRTWVERGVRLLSSQPDTSRAATAAVISVSVLKQAALRDRTLDPAPALAAVASDGGRLARPRFAAASAVDGRAVGEAFHRFMQWAELSRLGDAAAVRQERDRLVADGRLAAAESELVNIDNVVWVMSTPVGRALASASAIDRELPFVLAVSCDDAGSHVIVRGVVDALVRSAAGLHIVDYKTDVIASRAAWDERIAAYGVQLQVYGAALEAIEARPVIERHLVFVSRREIVAVPAPAEPLAALVRRAVAVPPATPTGRSP